MIFRIIAFEPIDDYDYGGVDWSLAMYDGAQKPKESLRYLFSVNNAQDVRTAMTFGYDNGQRLQNVNYAYGLSGDKVGNLMNLTNMVYNFKDQLIEKNIAFDSTHALQSIDYQYNTRGWLTAINNVNIYGGNGDDKKSIFTSGSTGKGTLKYFFK